MKRCRTCKEKINPSEQIRLILSKTIGSVYFCSLDCLKKYVEWLDEKVIKTEC